jgi:shikimate kinase
LHRLSSKKNRPLLNNKNRREVLEELAQKRYPIYASAHAKIETASGGYDLAIGKIINFLKNDKN